MNHEHTAQCKHIDHTIEEQITSLAEKIDYNNKITENLTQQVSGVASDLKAFKSEMKPWLEAKIGLNLLWRWGVTVPVIIGVIVGFKTLLGWLGFHK